MLEQVRRNRELKKSFDEDEEDISRLQVEEHSELKRLQEIQKRKLEVEAELQREKEHLENLQQMEKDAICLVEKPSLTVQYEVQISHFTSSENGYYFGSRLGQHSSSAIGTPE